ncbi:hypothetical protein ACWN56_05315 [Weissella viridescens]|uniref:Uncharacterized protein n=1 Tax=Weissella viridescens TaxID=1629 RepID=A0A0R2H1H1_WEIVI|nr:hypothetical protein [Weissella viridescens]KRN46187.1 hypothetical protein IV50_GL001163 [Weissella viridescens]MBX4172588.1 hypothetical protein [Weissella viridescens]
MKYEVPDKQIDPPDDPPCIAEDFEKQELYAGDTVWQDADGNYIDEELVTPYFERYLRYMGAELIELGE